MENVLKKNKTSGRTQGKLKYKTAVNPSEVTCESMLLHIQKMLCSGH